MVSHLLFADDSLLFFKANRESAVEVKNLLQAYCRASRQQINMDKSSIHFAKGCPGSLKEDIKNILAVENEALSEKYLGMPLMSIVHPMEHSSILKTGYGQECKGGWNICYRREGRKYSLKL